VEAHWFALYEGFMAEERNKDKEIKRPVPS